MQEGTLTFPLFTKADKPSWYEFGVDIVLLAYIAWGAFHLGLLGGTLIFAFAVLINLSQKIALFRRINSGVPAVQISGEAVRMVVYSGELWRLKWDEIEVVEEQWVTSGNPTLLLWKNTGTYFRIKVNRDSEVYRALRSALIDRLAPGTEISLLRQPRLYSLPHFLKGIGHISILTGFAFFLFGLQADQLRLTLVGLALMVVGGCLSASPAGWGRITLRAS